MRIKTFEAPTMQDALILAKQELGDDAVVLNTKHVKTGGVLGIGSTTMVQLMAATDTAVADTSQPAAPVAAQAVPQAVSVPQPAPMDMSQVVPAAPLAAQLYGGTATATAVAEPEPNNEVSQLRTELKELTGIVKGLLGSSGFAAPSAAPSAAPAKPLLSRVGVDDEIARTVLSGLASIEEPRQLALALAGKIQAYAVPFELDTPKVIAVVGPTGVGKTTTLAKLAAKFSLEQGKKVALITADTFRIGAVDQLRTYARIMGVPLEIALSPEEVAAAAAKHADKDVILMDTVGRSQRNAEHLQELKVFLEAAGDPEVHLVTSATLSAEVQREVVEKFSIFSPARVIVTKLDESPNRGCLINIPLSTGIAISCTTAGQNVPQDIDFAEAGKIAEFVMEGV